MRTYLYERMRTFQQ